MLGSFPGVRRCAASPGLTSAAPPGLCAPGPSRFHASEGVVNVSSSVPPIGLELNVGVVPRSARCAASPGLTSAAPPGLCDAVLSCLKLNRGWPLIESLAERLGCSRFDEVECH